MTANTPPIANATTPQVSKPAAKAPPPEPEPPRTDLSKQKHGIPATIVLPDGVQLSSRAGSWTDNEGFARAMPVIGVDLQPGKIRVSLVNQAEFKTPVSTSLNATIQRRAEP